MENTTEQPLFEHDGIRIDRNQHVHVDPKGDGDWYEPSQIPPLDVQTVSRLLDADDHTRNRFTRRIHDYLAMTA